MPIRFQCSDCGQKLSVGSKKAGARVKCPKCSKVVTVPSPEPVGATSDSTATAEKTVPAAPDTAPTAPQLDDAPAHDSAQEYHNNEDAFAQFAVYDDESEWVYESEDEGQDYDHTPAPQSETEIPIDREKLAVSRQVIYMQGGLLGVVALICFLLGLLLGWGTSGNQGPIAVVPCVVEGKVTFEADEAPDEGAVVVFLPQDAGPGQGRKLPSSPFRPGSSPAAEDTHAYTDLVSFGGGFARVDGDGEFQVKLPSQGRYYVLVVSQNISRSDNESLLDDDTREMNEYFLAAADVVGERQYRWSLESVNGDRKVDYHF